MAGCDWDAWVAGGDCGDWKASRPAEIRFGHRRPDRLSATANHGNHAGDHRILDRGIQKETDLGDVMESALYESEKPIANSPRFAWERTFHNTLDGSPNLMVR